MDISSLFISPTQTLRNALSTLNDGVLKLVLVVDEKKSLIGTLTDGDVRRGILNGFSLDDSVKKIMNQNFKYAKSTDKKEKVLRIMREYSLRQIPVLDSEKRVLRILLFKDIISTSRC